MDGGARVEVDGGHGLSVDDAVNTAAAAGLFGHRSSLLLLPSCLLLIRRLLPSLAVLCRQHIDRAVAGAIVPCLAAVEKFK